MRASISRRFSLCDPPSLSSIIYPPQQAPLVDLNVPRTPRAETEQPSVASRAAPQRTPFVKRLPAVQPSATSTDGAARAAVVRAVPTAVATAVLSAVATAVVPAVPPAMMPAVMPAVPPAMMPAVAPPAAVVPAGPPVVHTAVVPAYGAGFRRLSTEQCTTPSIAVRALATTEDRRRGRASKRQRATPTLVLPESDDVPLISGSSVKREAKPHSGSRRRAAKSDGGAPYRYRWTTRKGRKTLVCNGVTYTGNAAHKMWCEIKEAEGSVHHKRETISDGEEVPIRPATTTTVGRAQRRLHLTPEDESIGTSTSTRSSDDEEVPGEFDSFIVDDDEQTTAEDSTTVTSSGTFESDWKSTEDDGSVIIQSPHQRPTSTTTASLEPIFAQSTTGRDPRPPGFVVPSGPVTVARVVQGVRNTVMPASSLGSESSRYLNESQLFDEHYLTMDHEVVGGYVVE